MLTNTVVNLYYLCPRPAARQCALQCSIVIMYVCHTHTHTHCRSATRRRVDNSERLCVLQLHWYGKNKKQWVDYVLLLLQLHWYGKTKGKSVLIIFIIAATLVGNVQARRLCLHLFTSLFFLHSYSLLQLHGLGNVPRQLFLALVL